MHAEVRDGWLTLDGERMYMWKGSVGIPDATRHLKKGALVGASRFFQVDDFQWTESPFAKNDKLGLKDAEAWLENFAALETQNSSGSFPFFFALCQSNGRTQSVILLAPGDYGV